MSKLRSYADINFDDVDTEGKTERAAKKLPDGNYICKILNVSLYTSQKGNRFIKVDAEVITADDGDAYKGFRFSRFVNTSVFAPKGMFAIDLYRVLKPVYGDELKKVSSDEELFDLSNKIIGMTAKISVKNRPGSDFQDYKFYSF